MRYVTRNAEIEMTHLSAMSNILGVKQDRDTKLDVIVSYEQMYMLQHAKFTPYTFSELYRNNQKGIKFILPHPE